MAERGSNLDFTSPAMRHLQAIQQEANAFERREGPGIANRLAARYGNQTQFDAHHPRTQAERPPKRPQIPVDDNTSMLANPAIPPSSLYVPQTKSKRARLCETPSPRYSTSPPHVPSNSNSNPTSQNPSQFHSRQSALDTINSHLRPQHNGVAHKQRKRVVTRPATKGDNEQSIPFSSSSTLANRERGLWVPKSKRIITLPTTSDSQLPRKPASSTPQKTQKQKRIVNMPSPEPLLHRTPHPSTKVQFQITTQTSTKRPKPDILLFRPRDRLNSSPSKKPALLSLSKKPRVKKRKPKPIHLQDTSYGGTVLRESLCHPISRGIVLLFEDELIRFVSLHKTQKPGDALVFIHPINSYYRLILHKLCERFHCVSQSDGLYDERRIKIKCQGVFSGDDKKRLSMAEAKMESAESPHPSDSSPPNEDEMVKDIVRTSRIPKILLKDWLSSNSSHRQLSISSRQRIENIIGKAPDIKGARLKLTRVHLEASTNDKTGGEWTGVKQAILPLYNWAKLWKRLSPSGELLDIDENEEKGKGKGKEKEKEGKWTRGDFQTSSSFNSYDDRGDETSEDFDIEEASLNLSHILELTLSSKLSEQKAVFQRLSKCIAMNSRRTNILSQKAGEIKKRFAMEGNERGWIISKSNIRHVSHTYINLKKGGGPTSHHSALLLIATKVGKLESELNIERVISYLREVCLREVGDDVCKSLKIVNLSEAHGITKLLCGFLSDKVKRLKRGKRDTSVAKRMIGHALDRTYREQMKVKDAKKEKEKGKGNKIVTKGRGHNKGRFKMKKERRHLVKPFVSYS